jgi:hypothetical protein
VSSVAEMRARGDLDPQDRSRDDQSSRLFQASDNQAAAHELDRPNAVATLVYDAMRALVDVHLNASGLKVGGSDKHTTSVVYARTAMADIVGATDLDIDDELRNVRNKVVEYPPVVGFGSPQDLDHARYRDAGDRFLTAVRRWWESDGPR